MILSLLLATYSIFPYEIPLDRVQTLIDQMYEQPFEHFFTANGIILSKNPDRVWINPEILWESDEVIWVRAFNRKGDIVVEELYGDDKKNFQKVFIEIR